MKTGQGTVALYNGPDMELWGHIGLAYHAVGFNDPASVEFEAYIFEANIKGQDLAVYCSRSDLHRVEVQS